MALLEVDSLRAVFVTRRGEVPAVDGVSLTLDPGRALGLVGESGCGKSTLALSILGLLPKPAGRIVAGRVTFAGRELTRLSERELEDLRGHEIGMVFQDPQASLNPSLTVGDQIAETLRRHLGLSRRRARDRAAGLLEEVQMPRARERLDAYPHQLSGGMRQRVMIAMALSCEPRLLLADEPTTALDVTIQAQILQIMTRLARDMGVSVIIITHNLGVVARYADRVNVMYAGHIVESAPARELYQRPLHPYTLGLLRSVPRLDRARRQRLEPIEGFPPDQAHLPPGCPFQPRCRFAVERCQLENPPLMPLTDRRYSACWEWLRVAGESVAPAPAGGSGP